MWQKGSLGIRKMAVIAMKSGFNQEGSLDFETAGRKNGLSTL